ncbi:hypothetical protein BJ878DRAFT_527527 [Calycina marina]|uniref:ABM domain-containing protein n=1 Tax=Calycina marina TaxID=1763456 RepID=A0A9P7YUV8_9HELO|nr:hypothetical protein BJ878DRAFT_527527 [Calycina marina]
MSQVDLIAVITVKPGKAERVVELLKELAVFVKENEPETLRYHINLDSKKDQIIMLETYASKAAMGAHGQSKEFKAFQQKLADEDLVGGPMELKATKAMGGFESRL